MSKASAPNSGSIASKLLSTFSVDGSLRDILVPGTILTDWEVLLSNLKQAGYKLKISEPFDLTQNLNSVEAFRHSNENSPVKLEVALSPTNLVHCHFFTLDEIECDVDPRAIDDESDVERILGFMKFVGDALNKNVLLTEEDTRDVCLATYRPDTGEFLTI